MRCDEIQEQMIEFVYDEESVPLANVEMQEHLRACPACREEVEELKRTRKYLQLWKDEPPLRSVAIARHKAIAHRSAGRRYLGYAAIAAMVLICFMALANVQVSWNKDGFTFSTHLFPLPQQNVERDYYTKSELRGLMKDALEYTKEYTNETNYSMMQKVLDTVEQDRWSDMRHNRGQAAKNRN
jgi:hypothetical protein